MAVHAEPLRLSLVETGYPASAQVPVRWKANATLRPDLQAAAMRKKEKKIEKKEREKRVERRESGDGSVSQQKRRDLRKRERGGGETTQGRWTVLGATRGAKGEKKDRARRGKEQLEATREQDFGSADE
jgi:hypothetical protein